MKKELLILIVLNIMILLCSCGTENNSNESIINDLSVNSSNTLAEDTCILGDSISYSYIFDTTFKNLGYTGFFDTMLDTMTFSGTFYNITNMLYSDSLQKYVVFSPLTAAMERREQLVSNMISDAVLHYLKAEVYDSLTLFFTNVGAIRADHFKDKIDTWPEIEYSKIYKISEDREKYHYLPLGIEINSTILSALDYWGNKLVILKVKGKMLKDMFERGVSPISVGEGHHGCFGSFSGAKIEVDTSGVPDIGGNRIKKIWIKNTEDTKVWEFYSTDNFWKLVYSEDSGGWILPYSENYDFIVGTNNWIAAGGDGYTPLAVSKLTNMSVDLEYRIQDVVPLYFKNYKRYFGDTSCLLPKIDNRIIFKN